MSQQSADEYNTSEWKNLLSKLHDQQGQLATNIALLHYAGCKPHTTTTRTCLSEVTTALLFLLATTVKIDMQLTDQDESEGQEHNCEQQQCDRARRREVAIESRDYTAIKVIDQGDNE